MSDPNVSGVQQTIIAFGKARERIVAKVGTAITRATFDLVRYVKEQKLSDQVLRVRTGRLRRSITGRVEQENGSPVGLVGTNVGYGRVHELGFRGNVPVKAHVRKIKGNAFPVRAHQRNVFLPPRPFLNPSLDENSSKYQGWINAAIKEAADAPGS